MRIFLRERTCQKTGLDKSMQHLRQKRPRVKLSVKDYKLLHQRVLERDGWRCQGCGSSKDLQVHHMRARSKLGDDSLENLISLCANCHADLHWQPGS